ncbi:phosphotransferase system lactose/cellobiose-specific IIB subunit [Thermoanaerobacter italicus Ab9]|jgi:PTS system galactitol-specific IIB component|uniref:Phosphotransferase system lactose/cellobiose-specific IIB subunit n=1 Tax=Thermoanaerobacter italicus (strain DSM 9252 / Ab9) TaxID=580331 RepID=D3T5V2_THEIA|nr:PTS sugar transporter subunit IIB [Thermoanaerobacter italicus]ADD01483.1 phosphotransferase system lactose/cellobiose-specific IIB subunit [Thermoanaerobacter italicus Ab9]
METTEKNKKVRVLVVCADGVATSTVVFVSLREELEKRGIKAEFVQGRVMDVERMTKDGNFDFVVSTAGTSLDVEIPVISGVPFLTGIGREQVFNQILEIINKK